MSELDENEATSAEDANRIIERSGQLILKPKKD